MNAAKVRARAFFLNCRLRQWSCSSSRGQANYARQQPQQSLPVAIPLQNDDSKDRFRPYYVTTPIFYVNAEPHAGHLYTILLADVLKRWEVLKGDNQAALLTGTDEHGMKVQKAAEKLGMPTQELCDKNAQQFLQLAERANTSFDRFIRTTDPDHKAAVAHFWQELNKRGYIYEAVHEGWYSVSDETFYPESQVHLVLDPETGRKIYASKETGKEVEWTSEMNYHFRLSAFQDRLLEHYNQHPDFIVPSERFNYIKSEVGSGLQDLSISRPSSRLQWGIPVPNDPSQTIYVWLDALINYLTMTGYPSATDDRHKLWPPNVQVIGKDIVRFHTIYWPAFLMALDIPLPRAFLTHAHWTMGRAKMSKSLGNGVNPFFAMERYGLDTMRYFMIHDGGIVDDADYDNSYIVSRYKSNLQNALGNLLSRILFVRKSRWNVAESVAWMASNSSSCQPTQSVHDLRTKISLISAKGDDAMQQLNPRGAVQSITALVHTVNKFWQESAPWDLAASEKPEDVANLHQIVYTGAEAARVVCILLQPFMPDTMQQALDQLQVAQGKRRFEDAVYGCDLSYGQRNQDETRTGIAASQERTKGDMRHVLFPPLASEF